jgi:excisionase family DNA binding protein
MSERGRTCVKLLTPKQVAEMFQLSLATLSRMAGAGQIPHIILKTGRRKKVIRFRTEEVERWLSARTHGTKA